jgi:hypothetical protein
MSANLRSLIAEVDARIAQDPNLVETPVIAVRRVQFDPGWALQVYGPDWEVCFSKRHCTLCNAAVIVRPVFANCKTFICHPCTPKYFESVRRVQA